jgi:hypothetical protein
MAHRYRLTLRPIGIGCLPKGYDPFSAVGCDQPPKRYDFGSVSYPAKLSDEDVKHYDLVYLGEDVSKCCGAPTQVQRGSLPSTGIPEREYCTKCERPCDTVPKGGN